MLQQTKLLGHSQRSKRYHVPVFGQGKTLEDVQTAVRKTLVTVGHTNNYLENLKIKTRNTIKLLS